MRKILLLLVVLMMIIPACAANAEVEMLAASVGKGDAILLRAGDYVCLIDTGKKDAQDAVEAALEYWDVRALDAIFITHTDKDHTGGSSGCARAILKSGRSMPPNTTPTRPERSTRPPRPLKSWALR